MAIDHDDAPSPKLRDFIQRRGLGEVIRVHGGVDQADVAALERITDAELGDAPIDLVVDDASHRHALSVPTFDFFFPRLRPGGAYVLEDWATGLRVGGPQGLDPGERPLVDLVVDAITAKGRHPGLIADITVKAGWTIIERGPAPIEGTFDLAALA